MSVSAASSKSPGSNAEASFCELKTVAVFRLFTLSDGLNQHPNPYLCTLPVCIPCENGRCLRPCLPYTHDEALTNSGICGGR